MRVRPTTCRSISILSLTSRHRCIGYDIVYPMQMRSWTDDQLVEAVGRSVSIASVLRCLGLRPVGGNYKSIKTHIERLNLDVSHFTGQAWSAGKKFPVGSKGRPLEEILVVNSPHGSTYNLKRRLLAEGILVNKCATCGLADWLGNPISLHMDHINGENKDNRLENLRLLCPNCHSQTETYCGKKNKGRSNKRM